MSALFSLVFSVLLSGQLLDNEGHLAMVAPRAALLCGLLFAVHPIHTESVSQIVSFILMNVLFRKHLFLLKLNTLFVKIFKKSYFREKNTFIEVAFFQRDH